MDEGFFINREAKMVGRELGQGDAQTAANILREDSQHMNPREFSSLVSQTANYNSRNGLANLEIERDGSVVVQSNDGRLYNGGYLSAEETRRLMPEPPVVYEERPRREPDVVIVDRDRDYDHDRRDRYDHRGHDESRGLGSTTTDVIAGGLIGAGVARRGQEVKGAAVGVGAGLLLDQITKGLSDRH